MHRCHSKRCDDAEVKTTLALSDDILRDLRVLAQSRGVSLTNLTNTVLRAGLAAVNDSSRRSPRYVEEVVDLGVPAVDLDRALLIAASLEDEQTLRKLEQHK